MEELPNGGGDKLGAIYLGETIMKIQTYDDTLLNILNACQNGRMTCRKAAERIEALFEKRQRDRQWDKTVPADLAEKLRRDFNLDFRPGK